MGDFEPREPGDSSQIDPIDLLFGGLSKLGPGDDAHTRQMLGLLPAQDFRRVVDAGCGTGRQSLVLARELSTLIHCVDVHRPFLDELLLRAQAQGLQHLVQPHHFDMCSLAAEFDAIDLLWSEGAAYNLGFAGATAAWAPAIKPGGFAVISECSWLCDDPPADAQRFWQSAYPSMASAGENVRVAETSGFRCLSTHTLPKNAWIDGYYEVLEVRASKLVEDRDPAVRALANETLQEISLFRTAGDSYGYVFYILERV
jgi:SAM-dependent methyltransferase